MSSTPRIVFLLAEIVDLLKAHDESDWAQCFQRLLDEYNSDPHGACSQIRSIYGGMGLFNDLILHGPDGIPLQKENDRLDRYRMELYELCQPGKRY
jgi:hypothetical protein